MNTKEAIEFIEFRKKDLQLGIDFLKSKNIIKVGNCSGFDEVIELLKRGEKFEKIWGEIEDKYGAYTIHECYKGYLSISNLLANFKQKYFPKELKL